MPTVVWTAAGGVGGAVVAALVSYLIARRKTSGSVDTSEADSLWRESRVLREELRDEVKAYRENLIAAQAEAAQLRTSLYQAQLKTGELTLRVAALEQRLQKYEDGFK